MHCPVNRNFIKHPAILLCFLLLISFEISFCQSIGSDSLVPYRVGNKWGYSDLKGNLVIEPRYESATFFYKNRAIVEEKNIFYLINPQNKKSSKDCQKIILRTDCDYICYRALIKDKVETLDTNGNHYYLEWGPGCTEDISGPREDDILIKSYSELRVYKEYFRNDSQKVLYKMIRPTNVDNKYFYVYTKSKSGVVYNDGKFIKTLLDTVYQHTRMYKSQKFEYMYVVKKDDLTALITQYETIIPFKYKSITPNEINKGMLLVETVNSKKGYVSFSGFEYFKD